MSLIHNANVVRDGLVLYLDAANPKSYPGSGATLFDLSGNNNNGSIINNPVLSGGIINLSGTNDYINTNLTINYSALSLCCWVKNSTSTQGGIITKGPVNGTEYGICFGYSSPVLLVCRSGSAGGQITMTWQGTPYATGWHYVCLTIGNGLKTLYIDDIQISQNSGSTPNAVESFQIGFHGSTFYFDGQLALPKIYNRVLSATEIAQNFEATRGRYSI